MSFRKTKVASPVKKKILIAASALVLVTAIVFGLMGFLKPSDAAGSIELDYSGGTRLVNDVTFDANKINAMVDLLGDDSKLINAEGDWLEGYDDVGKVKFLVIPSGSKDWVNTYWVTHGKYIDIKVTLIRSVSNRSNDQTMYTYSAGSSVEFGRNIYDQDGNLLFDTHFHEEPTYPGVFFQFHIDVYKAGTQDKVEIPRIYFEISDIDAAQSYKLVSEPLSSSKMYAKSDPPFDTNQGITTSSQAQHNYFNESTGVIYSSYCTQYTSPVCDDGENYDTFLSDGDANVYTKLSKVYDEGIDIIYGFHIRAGSGIGLTTEQYRVSYVADDGGSVSADYEDVLADDTIKDGPTPIPDEGYEFVNWTADQDVTLKDGTVIHRGQPITMDQIKQIIVTEDISFTAHFANLPKLSIMKSADKTEYKVGDTINYVLTVNQIVEDAEARNVVITDQLSNANIIKYDKNSFKVFLNNNDITNQADIAVRENDFEIKTHQNIDENDKIVVAYSAKALNPIEKLVNTAKASCENSEGEAVAETKFTIKIVADAPNTGLMANDPEGTSAETDINFNLIIAGVAVAVFFTIIYIYRRIRNKVRFN